MRLILGSMLLIFAASASWWALQPTVWIPICVAWRW